MSQLKKDKTYENILPFVSIFTTTEDDNDLPDDVILEYIKMSAIELFRESTYLKRWIKIKGQCGVNDYPIHNDIDDDYRIVTIHRLLVGGFDFSPSTDEAEYPVGNCDFRQAYWIDDSGWLNINPAPFEDDCDIDVYVSLCPTTESCNIPWMAFEEFGMAIADGAASHLLNMIGESWYNPRLAIQKRQSFLEGIKRARVKAIKGGLSGKNHEKNARLSRYGKSWSSQRFMRVR